MLYNQPFSDHKPFLGHMQMHVNLCMNAFLNQRTETSVSSKSSTYGTAVMLLPDELSMFPCESNFIFDNNNTHHTRSL